MFFKHSAGVSQKVALIWFSGSHEKLIRENLVRQFCFPVLIICIISGTNKVQSRAYQERSNCFRNACTFCLLYFSFV